MISSNITAKRMTLPQKMAKLRDKGTNLTTSFINNKWGGIEYVQGFMINIWQNVNYRQKFNPFFRSWPSVYLDRYYSDTIGIPDTFVWYSDPTNGSLIGRILGFLMGRDPIQAPKKAQNNTITPPVGALGCLSTI